MKQPLSEELKVRIPSAWKKRIEAIAKHEGAKSSEIGRRALAQFLRSNRHKAATA